MGKKLAGAYNFTKWETVGQALTGILLRVEDVEINGETVPCLFVTDKHGHEASATAGKIVRDTLAKADMTGKVISVVYTGTTKNKKGQPLKTFDVYDLSDEYPDPAAFLAGAKAAPKADDDEDDDLPF